MMRIRTSGNRVPKHSVWTKVLLAAAVTFAAPLAPMQARDAGSVHAQVAEGGGRARMNVAGRLPILGQTMAAAACMLDEGYDIAHETTLLREAHDDFMRMLDALQHGDPSVGIPTPENFAKTNAEIDELRVLWAPMEQSVMALLDGDHPHEHAAIIAQSNQALLEQSELLFSVILNQYTDPFEMMMADAIAVSFAERQEMFAEKLKREACEIGGGHAEADIADDFAKTIALFDASLRALHDGYEAVGIRPPPNALIEGHLEDALAEWVEAQSTLQVVTQSGGATEEQMVAIREVTERLDHTMHAIVIEYLLAAPGANDMVVGPVTEYANHVLAQWVADPVIVASVRAHNAKTADMPHDVLQGQDAQWVAELVNGSGPLIKQVTADPASERLVMLQSATSDIVTEAFIMDLRGANVAESEPTTQYWHLHEKRYLEIARKRDVPIFVSDVHVEEGGNVYQAQVSLPIKDPDTFELIGVATFGVNVQAMF